MKHLKKYEAYSDILKNYAKELIDSGYRGLDYALKGEKPPTARRKMCILENGRIVHYDAFASSDEEKLKYKDLRKWKHLGIGKQWTPDGEGLEGWFYIKKVK